VTLVLITAMCYNNTVCVWLCMRTSTFIVVFFSVRDETFSTAYVLDLAYQKLLITWITLNS
jgi:hypothetical protein